MKKLINLLLLVVMGFSVAHGVVFDAHEESHCSVQEYVAEFSAPIHHDEFSKIEHEHENDMCDSHFMFHVSFLLPINFSLFEPSSSSFTPNSKNKSFSFSYQNNTFRPPIV